MSFSCPICSDSLARVPPDPTNTEGVKISCAPCGHLFHAFCIQKWLRGTLATSSQCPCCRVTIPRKKCLPLYPTTQDDSILDDTVGGELIPCNHGPVLDDLRGKILKLERELAHTEQLKKTLSDDFDRVQNKLRSERTKYDQLLIKYKQMESLETYADEMKAKLHIAQAELNSLKSLQATLDSIRNGVEYKEQVYSLTQESLEDLKTMKAMLTRELKSARKKQQEALQMQETLRSESRRAKNEVVKLRKEKENLENDVANLKIELEDMQKAAGQSITGSPSLTVTPNRKRKSDSDNKLLHLDESVIELSPEVDNDIMVFKPFHSAGRRLKLPRKPKSSNDLNSAFSSSSGCSKTKNSVGCGDLKSSRSASDVLSDDCVSLLSAKNCQKSSRHKPIQEDSFEDFATLGFNANLKSSLPGLAVTPASSYRRAESKTGFGIPKPPKILKK